jgi:aminoglycoside 2''-phosphotransferase
MSDHARFLDRIREVTPELGIVTSRHIQEGMVNDVVIVNDQIVFRFPKTVQGQEDLAHEARVLDIVRRHVAVPVPAPVLHRPDVASHRMVQGVPLMREDLYRLSPARRRAVMEDLGRFLRDLHAIPARELADVGLSHSIRTADVWRAMYARIEETLFPLLFRNQRESVRRHFAPVLEGRLRLDVDPVLVHGDLAPYHILVDPECTRLTGVIDFGTVGLGDPAVDIATLLAHYGGRLVDDMRATYPFDDATWERACFRAGCLELEWALIGLERNDLSMLVAHIGGARDYLPMDAFRETS